MRANEETGPGAVRILCFIDGLGSGGAQRQLVNLAVLFKRRGHQVDFLVYNRSDFFLPILERHDITVSRVDSRSHLGRVVKCCRFFRNHNHDVVISFLDTPNFIACVCSMTRHRWRLITNELSARPGAFEEVKPRAMKAFQRYADLLVCNSEQARRLWMARASRHERAPRVIYNPVMIECLGDQSLVLGHVRRIVIAASYRQVKNPQLLVRAVAALTDEDRRRLKIDWYGNPEPSAGDTTLFDEVRRLAVQTGVDDVVSFNTETTDIYAEMSAADAVGLFSEYEGLPNAICEAMALGKPVIMTKVSDYGVLVDAANGFLCPSTDVPGVASALRRMLAADDATLRSMGEESRAKARALFEPERIADRWLEAIETVMGG